MKPSAPAGLSRRRVLAAAAAATVAAPALAGRASQAQVLAQAPAAPRSGRTFVCISAAWCGGWIWARVADRLRARGHRVFTPTLTGLGERAHLLSARVNLDTHIADVVNVMRWEDLRDVTLVGHSYGGIVAAGVIEKTLPSLASAIFVDAFMPKDGDSLMQSASPRFRDMMQAALARKEIAVKPVAATVFGVNAKDAPWFNAKTTAHPLAALTQPVRLTGARDKLARKAYIRAVEYDQPSFQDYYEDRRKDAAWKTASVPGGHCPMIDAPERLSQLLEELA